MKKKREQRDGAMTLGGHDARVTPTKGERKWMEMNTRNSSFFFYTTEFKIVNVK